MNWFITCSFTLLHICLMPSKAMLLPPINLTVEVLDFMATIQWLPAPGNPPGTTYTLEFIPAQSISEGKWNKYANCCNITTLKCDLTFDLQPDDLKNYFVRVKTVLNGASSNWTTTLKSFQPYGDTRLSSPKVKISTNQTSVTINFSHRLNGIKPLEFLIYLFENNPAGKSKLVAQESTSKSPYIFYEMPPGNFCINVSARHQEAMHKNNFNTTECFSLTGSSERSSAGLLWIGAIVLSITVALSCVCVYQIYRYINKYIIKDIWIPEALRVIPGPKRVLKFGLENLHQITQTRPNDHISTEDFISASEEDNTLLYQSRESTNVILNLSSVLHQPNPDDEDAETLKQYSSVYNLATNMEESEENTISENGDDDDMHLGATVALCPTSKLSLLTGSEAPHISTVNIGPDRDEETERLCEGCYDNSHESVASDEEDNVSWDDVFTGDGYEPRPDPRTFEV